MERSEQERQEYTMQEFLDRYFPTQDSTVRKESLRKPTAISREELRPLLEMGETVESILSRAVERGYVLHGSPTEVAVLKPQKATGLGREHEQRYAVYATDTPAVAIFRAITQQEGRRGSRGSFYTEWDEVDGTLQFRANRAALQAMGDGKVYVLHREGFVQEEGDFMCDDVCTPQAVIAVGKDNFRYPIEEIADKRN